MNKYQKLISQITKDDIKKRIYIALGTNFRKHRRILRFGFRDMTIQEIRDFKNLAKKLHI